MTDPSLIELYAALGRFRSQCEDLKFAASAAFDAAANMVSQIVCTVDSILHNKAPASASSPLPWPKRSYRVVLTPKVMEGWIPIPCNETFGPKEQHFLLNRYGASKAVSVLLDHIQCGFTLPKKQFKELLALCQARRGDILTLDEFSPGVFSFAVVPLKAPLPVHRPKRSSKPAKRVAKRELAKPEAAKPDDFDPF